MDIQSIIGEVYGSKPSPQTTDFEDIISRVSSEYGVDPGYVKAHIKAESDFNPAAIGPETKYGTAKGLMQLLDSTAADLGVTDPIDPEQNITGGTKYLSQLLNRYGGDQKKASAAYHAGMGNIDTAVERYGDQWLDNLHEITGKHAKTTRSYLNKIGGENGKPPQSSTGLSRSKTGQSDVWRKAFGYRGRKEPDINDLIQEIYGPPAPPEEEPGIIKSAGRGLTHGAIGLAETAGTALEYLGHRFDSGGMVKAGKTAKDYWRKKAEPFGPHKEIAGKNVWDNPELLADTSWWAYNVADMVPAFAAMMVPAAGVEAAMVKIGSRAVPFTSQAMQRLFNIGRKVAVVGTAGLTGGGIEGLSTYNQVLESGGSEKEAARAGEFMTIASGILNSIGINKILQKAGAGFKAKLIKAFGSGVWEGITEGLEEPSEVISKVLAGYVEGKPIPEDITDQLIESLKDALTVAPIAGVTGAGGSVIHDIASKQTVSDPDIRKEISDNIAIQKKRAAKEIRDEMVADEMAKEPDWENLEKLRKESPPHFKPVEGKAFAAPKEKTTGDVLAQAAEKEAQEKAEAEHQKKYAEGDLLETPEAKEIIKRAQKELKKAKKEAAKQNDWSYHNKLKDDIRKARMPNVPQNKEALNRIWNEFAPDVNEPAELRTHFEPSEEEIHAGEIRKDEKEVSPQRVADKKGQGVGGEGVQRTEEAGAESSYAKEELQEEAGQKEEPGPEPETIEVSGKSYIKQQGQWYDAAGRKVPYSQIEKRLKKAKAKEMVAGPGRRVGPERRTEPHEGSVERRKKERRAIAKRKAVERLSPDEKAYVIPELRRMLKTQKKAALRQERIANSDPLTGLKNRRGLEKATVQRKNEGKESYHTFIDLIGFKGLNDNVSHEAGDECLKHISKAMKAVGLESATRWGGDELMFQADSVESGEEGAQKLREYFEENPLRVKDPKGKEYDLTVMFRHGTAKGIEEADEVAEAKKAEEPAEWKRGKAHPGLKEVSGKVEAQIDEMVSKQAQKRAAKKAKSEGKKLKAEVVPVPEAEKPEKVEGAKAEEVVKDEKAGKQVEESINSEIKGLVKYDGAYESFEGYEGPEIYQFTTREDYGELPKGQTFTVTGTPTTENVKAALDRKAKEFGVKPGKFEEKPPPSPKKTDVALEGEGGEKIVSGKKNKAYLSDNTEIKTEYAVVDASNLIASHDDNLVENKAFPKDLQPRDRSRKGMRLQVETMAKGLIPERLGGSSSVTTGAPIVGEDLIVESGNGRIIAIRKAYEKSSKYKDWLKTNAEKFGLKKEDIESLGKPVLVRIRKSDVNRLEFVKTANQGEVARMSPTEAAKSDAERLNDADISIFEPSDEGNISSIRNAQSDSLKALSTEEILYSTTEPKAKTTTDQVFDVVLPYIQGMAQFPTVRVVQSIGQLPNRLKSKVTAFSKKSNKQVEGFYDKVDDQVFLIADNLSEGRIEAVLRHEAEGHRGIRLLLGPELDGFLDQVARSKRKDLERHDPGLNFKDQAAVRVAADEWIARKIEAGDLGKSFWDDLVRIFRKWLRKFVPDLDLTDGEIRSVLTDTVKNVRDGRIDQRQTSKQDILKNPNFKAWFKGSKVVDKNGSPLTVYHGTGIDFDSFKVTNASLGAHFATVPNVASRFAQAEKGQVYPVYLRMKNPLRLQDNGMWFAKDIIPQMQKLGIIKQREVVRFWKNNPNNTLEAARYLKDFIRSKGYDGIIYLNRYEIVGREEEDSPTERIHKALDLRKKNPSDKEFKKEIPESSDAYIIFSPAQAKSIYNRGTFGEIDPRILYSKKKRDINEPMTSKKGPGDDITAKKTSQPEGGQRYPIKFGEEPKIGEREFNENLLVYLDGPNTQQMKDRFGKEKVGKKFENITRYDGEFGSWRYVYKNDNGENVGVVQGVSSERTGSIISNVYVRPDFRRQGIASKILDIIDADQIDISVDSGLSKSGAGLMGITTKQASESPMGGEFISKSETSPKTVNDILAGGIEYAKSLNDNEIKNLSYGIKNFSFAASDTPYSKESRAVLNYLEQRLKDAEGYSIPSHIVSMEDKIRHMVGNYWQAPSEKGSKDKGWFIETWDKGKDVLTFFDKETGSTIEINGYQETFKYPARKQDAIDEAFKAHGKNAFLQKSLPKPSSPPGKGGQDLLFSTTPISESDAKKPLNRFIQKGKLNKKAFFDRTAIDLPSNDPKDLIKGFRWIQTMQDMAKNFPNMRRLFEVEKQRIAESNFDSVRDRETTEDYFTLGKESEERVNRALLDGDELGEIYTDKQLVDDYGLNSEEIAGYRAVRKALGEKLDEHVERILSDVIDTTQTPVTPEMVKDVKAAKTEDDLKEVLMYHFASEYEAAKLPWLVNWLKEFKGYVPHKWDADWLVKVNMGKDKEYMFEVPAIGGKAKPTRKGRQKAAKKVAVQVIREKLDLSDDEIRDLAANNKIVVVRARDLPIDLFEGARMDVIQSIVNDAQDKMWKETVRHMTPEQAKDFMEMQDLLKGHIQEMYLAKGWGRHLMGRRGVKGYRTDLKNVISSYLIGANKFAAKGKAAKRFAGVMKDVSPTETPEQWKHGKQFVSDMLGESSEAGWFKKIAGTWFLAGDLSAAVLNMTQNWTHAVPMLRSIKPREDRITSEKEIYRAMRDIAAEYTTTRGKDKKIFSQASTHISQDEINALQRAYGEGNLDPAFLGETTGYHASKIWDNYSKKIWGVLFKLFTGAEGWNRTSTFLAAYRRSKRAGMNNDEAVDKAVEIVETAHFTYGRGNRPQAIRATGAVGNIGWTFMTYPVNNLIFLKHRCEDLLNDLHSGNKEAIKTDMKVIGSNLGYLFAFGGLIGLPFAYLAQSVLNLFDDDEEDWELLIRKHTPGRTGRAITRGIPAAFLGNDMSWRVQGTDVVGMPVGFQIAQMGKRRLEKAHKLWGQGDEIAAIFHLMPDMIRNPYRAVMGYKEGGTRTGVPPIKYTTGEAITKALSFTPTREAETWKAGEVTRKARLLRLENLENFAEKYLTSRKAKDRAAIAEIKRDLQAYNKRQKKKGRIALRISWKDLMKSAKMRRRSRSKSYREHVPKYMQRYQKGVERTLGMD